MFNTLSYAKKLEGVGVSREQAEAHVQIIAEIVEGGLATKQDIRDLREIDLKAIRDDMQKIEYRMTIKLGAFFVAGIAILASIMKIH
ncbi:MAG: hypothetical protein AB7K68_14560 [Bacteriovoracia bacterium]